VKTYLDIETSFSGEITVIGMYRPTKGIVQLVAEEANPEKLLDFLEGSHIICTYNGSRFDLPVIKNNLGVDLVSEFKSHDLMFDCWSQNLYGGLKVVEKKLGIPRTSADLTGYDALLLWEQYQKYNNVKALERLLEYNKEDVLNLCVLEEKLLNVPRSK
jgi:uncharacterized protein YprB with RNaseH-like and TPR domain